MGWRGYIILMMAVGCSEDVPRSSAPKTTVAEPRATTPAIDAAPAIDDASFIKAQLNKRLVTFDRAAVRDNYLSGANLRLHATTAEGEFFEIVATNAIETGTATSYPLVLKTNDGTQILVRYSTGSGSEWTATDATLTIESFDDGHLVGSFNASRLRPNKPAIPIRISGGRFDLRVQTR